MGRTLPTIVQTLQAEQEAWKLFRRALRKEDQEAFDALWRFARYHAAPASMASRPMPFEAALMAMLVAMERQLLELEKEKKNGDGGGVAL
ncbi:MAG: hypothetical protein HYX59_01615 [Elusimicrobia bacterium]|nr:hypothetical protein [Elusimicrobiota bacterium]